MTSRLGDVIRPGTTRGLDFVIIDELRKRTGVGPESAPRVALTEMLCNALDKNATEIEVDIRGEGEFNLLTVRDNGSKKLSLREIRMILDFEKKASSKRGLLRVSRGYLGNALKCIFGYSYALAESRGLAPPVIVVRSGHCEYRISLKPDQVKGVIKSEILTLKSQDGGFTTFVVKFPKDDSILQGSHPSNPSVLKDLIYATAMVNPTRRISYSIFGEERQLGSAQSESGIRQETSILWYTRKQFQSLFEDFRRARPETQLKEFIPLFRGFAGKKVNREILQALSFRNHDSRENSPVQFFPATPIRNLPNDAVSRLFSVMKSRAKPIAKRSIPSILGVVGEEAFEKVREREGWERLRYVMIPGIRVECRESYHEGGPCCSEDHVEFPYLVEVAVFDRKSDDTEGLKVYQCVNRMASTEDIFSRIFDINYRLGRVEIREDTPVTVVAHLVCPVLKWLDYGKSGLDE